MGISNLGLRISDWGLGGDWLGASDAKIQGIGVHCLRKPVAD